MAIFRSVYADIFLLLSFLLPLQQVSTYLYDPSVYPSAFFHNSFYQQQWWPPHLLPALTDHEMCSRCQGGNFCKTTSHSFCLNYGSNSWCNQRDVRRCHVVLPETNRGSGPAYHPQPVCSHTGSHCSQSRSCCDFDARCNRKSHICCKRAGSSCESYADCCGSNTCYGRTCCRPINAKCINDIECCSHSCRPDGPKKKCAQFPLSAGWSVPRKLCHSRVGVFCEHSIYAPR